MTEPATQARQDAKDALILMGAEPEGAEATIIAIEAEAAQEQKRLDNNELFRRGVETGEAYEAVIAATAAEAVKPWREALDFRASVTFPNLDHQPTGPELLRAVAHWMDGVDDREGNPDREVQADLRKWADKAEAMLAAPPESGT